MTNRDMVKDGAKGRPLPEPQPRAADAGAGPGGRRAPLHDGGPARTRRNRTRSSTRRSRSAGASPDRARLPGGAGITLPATMRGEKRCRPKTSSSASMSAPRSAATAARLRRFAPTISRRCRSANCSAATRASPRPSTRSSTAAPTRPARITATSRAWRRCSPGCRSARPPPPSTACAPPASMRSARRRGRSRPARSSSRSPAGSKSMTRAPFVTGKSEAAFQRTTETYDTTIGWRFINPVLKAQYGVDAMPETGENVAAGVPGHARGAGRFRAARARSAPPGRRPTAPSRADIVPVEIPDRKGAGARRQGRAPARRHDARHARQARSRSYARAGRSRPATRRASTTAPPP